MSQFDRRRQLLKSGLVVPAIALLGITEKSAAESSKQLDCTPGSKHTPRQTSGPFFTPDTPLKKDFRTDDPGGQAFRLNCSVQTPDCEVVKDAMVELWHADSQGRYDNQGYRMRGHQFTNATGQFEFLTNRPGRYPGRTPHFHVTIKTRDGRSLTTQLYFPGEPQNARDGIYDDRLEMTIEDGSEAPVGRYSFVLA